MTTTPAPERRAHRRFKLECPAELAGGAEEGPCRCRVLDLSDGGALLRGPTAPPVGQVVAVRLRLPRQTANTFMYEDVAAPARVVRHHGAASAWAVAFQRPLPLHLEA